MTRDPLPHRPNRRPHRRRSTRLILEQLDERCLLAVFAVSSIADPGDGTCDTTECTLREAIIAANATPGADVITVPAGTYTLTIVGTDEDAAATGDLDITDDLTITGSTGDPDDVIIQAATAPDTGIDRVFHVLDPAGGEGAPTTDATLTGVTVRHGLTITDGGGILHSGAGTVEVRLSVVSDNLATAAVGGGGGLANVSTGTLSVVSSLVQDNSAAFDGGGLYNSGGGTLNVIQSTVSSNSAGSEGGGLYNEAGSATIINSTFSGNQAAELGGGIYNDAAGQLSSTNATITANRANTGGTGTSGVGFGGGLFNDAGHALLHNTIVAGNTAGTPASPTDDDVAGPAPGSAILVTDGGDPRRSADPGIIRVDPVTGDRSVLSGPSIGTGAAFATPRGIALDAAGRILVTDTDADALFRIDPVTGDRTILSDDSDAVAPFFNFDNPRAVTVDASGGILVTVRDAGATEPGVFRVDATTGTRTILSDRNTGMGPNFNEPGGITRDPFGRILVADRFDEVVVRVDPLTGDRTVISDPLGDEPDGIIVDGNGRILVAARFDDAVLAVDPVTGAVSILSDATHGTGPNFLNPRGLALHPDGRIIVIDKDAEAVFLVDPVTGDRTILSDGTTGTGPGFTHPLGVVFMPSSQGTLDPASSFNLIGVPGTSGLVNGVNGNQVGSAASPLDPQLGPLANNGGPTQTHALSAGSPAIDAGDDAVLVPPLSLATDQRGTGFPRLSGSHVDIGALEFVGAEGLGEISGSKFNDLNGNGVREPGEPGLSGWSIDLRDDQGNLLSVRTTMSIDVNGDGGIDPDTEQGLYRFTDLAPGTFTVSEVLQPDWQQTFPSRAPLPPSFPLGFAPSPPIGGTIRRVPADFPTIQAAINAAAAGDTVLVSPGTYVENINFLGKAITVTTTDGPNFTIIDGNQADSVVTFATGEGLNSVVHGFTVRNGRSGFDTPGFGDGGGVRVQGASPTVTGNVIVDNRACSGAGISSSSGSPIIQGNIIARNFKAGCFGGPGGGGVFIGGLSPARLLDNLIAENFSTDGGGLALFSSGAPTIRGNVIRGNTATGNSPCSTGGGIAMFNESDALIVQNLIVGNTAGCGGGVAWAVPFGTRGPLLVNNTIADNDSPLGSGIYADGFDALTESVNNIIVGRLGQTAVFCTDLRDATPPIFRSNDVISPAGRGFDGSCARLGRRNKNVAVDPRFVDGPNGNYRLQIGSPIVDAGDNTAPSLPASDWDGGGRVLDGNGDGKSVVDMGVDELGGPPNKYTVVLDAGERVGTADFGNVMVAGGCRRGLEGPPTATGAGNVKVRVQNGRLAIKGDSAGVDVQVESGPNPGSYRISGRGGTRVNGQTAPVDVVGVTGSVLIRTGRGHDTVFLDGSVTPLSFPADLSILTSAGDDTVWLDPLSVTGRTRINTGVGDDTVAIIDALLSRGLTARTRAGDDDLTACDADVTGRVRSRTGRGPDSVVVDDSIFRGDLSLTTGAGGDTVRLERQGDPGGPETEFRGAVSLRTRRGSDSIEVGVAGELGNSAQVFACSKFRGGRGPDELDAGLASDPNANGNTFTCEPVVRGIERHRS